MTKTIIESSLKRIEVLKTDSKFEEAIIEAKRLLLDKSVLQDADLKTKILISLGNLYFTTSDYPKALECYFEILSRYEELDDKNGIAIYLGNTGNVYRILSDFPKALEQYEKALSINEEIGSKPGIAANLGNIGIIFRTMGDYEASLEYYKKALSINEETANAKAVSINLVNIGNVYNTQMKYEKALEYYEKSLTVNHKVKDKELIAANNSNIGAVYLKLFEYSKAIEHIKKSLSVAEEIGNKHGIAFNLLNLGVIYSRLSEFSTSKEYLNKCFRMANELEDKILVVDCLDALSKLYEYNGDIENAFRYHKQFVNVKDEIHSAETRKKALLFDQKRILEEDEKARQLKLAQFKEQEKLLHNILPINIANRILKKETFIADHFESVTVLFMDLVGFTPLASIAPPKQLVFILDTIFSRADEILESFGLEKIKTIGDGYMGVANLTKFFDEHQKATALAALELIKELKEFTISFPKELGSTKWTKNMKDIEIRIGIHTGEVVAGIIGKNKFTYDLWGDAVNIASRMESNSEPWKIHVSEAFAKSISKYKEFKLVSRGDVYIKGKGTMNTFWLENVK